MTALRGRRSTHLDLPELALALVVLGLVGTWATRLSRLARSVVSYGSYWSHAQGTPGGLTYVALGDSAAQGIGASRPERGYVGLLAQRMREHAGRDVLVVNLSASGATARHVVEEQLPKLAALRADVVTVAIGGNDVPWYDAATFDSDMGELIDLLPPGTLVADVPYFMHGRWERHARSAGDVVRRRAGDAGLQVVALHDAARDRGSRAMLTDFAADWFHPNDSGHRVWADAFWTVLRQVPEFSAGTVRTSHASSSVRGESVAADRPGQLSPRPRRARPVTAVIARGAHSRTSST